MSLHSFSFLFFMAVVAGIYYVFPRRYRYIWLCAASLFFIFPMTSGISGGCSYARL